MTDRRPAGQSGAAAQAPPDARRPSRPGRRSRPGWPSQPVKTPVRPASPVRPPGPGRSGRPVRTAEYQAGLGQRGQVGQARPAGAESAGPAHRTSFVLLLLGLLGGGMVCLLVVNTTLAANSIQIGQLQQQNANVSEQVQELAQQVATARSAAAIEAEARKLGMRTDPHLVFIDLHKKKIVSQPGNRAMPAARSAHRATSARDKTARDKRAPGGTGQ